MGRFINGQHISWTSKLGPNERFGEGDDMEFQDLALKLEALNELMTKLETYHEHREDAIALIKNIIEKYSDINYTASKKLTQFLDESEAARRLLDYYTKKFKSQ